LDSSIDEFSKLEVISNPIMAATMWGQGKNVWQAEVDAHAELAIQLQIC
jgi:hypothetical protein